MSSPQPPSQQPPDQSPNQPSNQPPQEPVNQSPADPSLANQSPYPQAPQPPTPQTPAPQTPQSLENVAPKPASNPAPAPSKTILGRLSEMAQKVSRVHFSQLRLNPDAKPPKLMVHDPNTRQRKEYALLGEYYLVGRSSEMDITVANPIVSTEHLSLRKVPGWFRPVFVLQDRKSTNG
ncbi:MAG: FHA domain-containing protein, partial [Cyanobacteria bacterium P01_D01_bin.73]